MSLIYIKKIFSNRHSVTIRVDGILDSESIPILKKFCKRYFKGNKEVQLHLGGLRHLSREGMKFLQEIRKRVIYVEPPKFVRLEDQNINGRGLGKI